MLTGEVRYRTNFFGKLILQVQVSRHLDQMDLGSPKMKIWRDATAKDLPVFTYTGEEARGKNEKD